MEKHVAYNPIAQNDAPESSYGDSEDMISGVEHKQRGTVVLYAKRAVLIAILLVLYTGAVVELTKRVTHRDRRVGRRFLNTPVDNDYIVYDAKVMEQWEDLGKGPRIEYFTEPSEEIDRNWHDIVERMSFAPFSAWFR
jgi:hypothetical protein